MVLWHKFNISQGIWRRGAREVTKSNSWQVVGGGATSTLPGTEEPSVIIQKTKGGKDKIPMQGAEFSFLFEAKAKAEDGEKISRQS